jgi:predicted N-acetyltransferase YhbS
MIVRAASPEDFDEIIALELKAFPSLREDMIRAFVSNDPWGRLEHTRVAVIDGQVASVVRIAKRPIRLGSAVVWLGGISGVGTLPKFRKRGGASACVQDALAYMRERGMPLSALFTDINPFYERLGYQTLPTPSFRFRIPSGTAGVSPATGDIMVRQADPSRDLDAVTRLYDSFNDGRALTVARSPEYWRAWPTWATWETYVFETPEAFLIAERDGMPVAYSRAKLAPRREKTAELMEMCCLRGEEHACLPLFARTCELARERGFEAFRASLPRDHPLLAQVAQAGVSVEREEFTSMMWRVVDLRGLLAATLPDLSRHCVMAGEWGLTVGDQRLTLRYAPGSVTLSDARAEPMEVGPAALVALLSGHALPATPDVAALRERSPALLGVLNIGRHFPAPVYWRADDF